MLWFFKTYVWLYLILCRQHMHIVECLVLVISIIETILLGMSGQCSPWVWGHTERPDIFGCWNVIILLWEKTTRVLKSRSVECSRASNFLWLLGTCLWGLGIYYSDFASSRLCLPLVLVWVSSWIKKLPQIKRLLSKGVKVDIVRSVEYFMPYSVSSSSCSFTHLYNRTILHISLLKTSK